MNIAHSVAIRVFCGEEENEDEIVNGLRQLVPLDFEKEKIHVQMHSAFGFNEKRITIFEAALTKNRHVKAFLDNPLQKLDGAQKQMLLRQIDSRTDNEGNFFIRLEKESLAKRNDLLVTDGGNCYHLKIKMAAFPNTKENAVEKVKNELLGR